MPGFDPLTAIVNTVNTVLNRVLPDKVANDAAKVELAKMELAGELQQVMGQLQINQTEAASQSVFVAGWRPFIGWICGIALAVDFVIRPFVMWVCNVCHHPADFPTLDMTELMPLVLALLGLGAMRSYDKTQNTSNGS